jgi:hypothetical protein
MFRNMVPLTLTIAFITSGCGTDVRAGPADPETTVSNYLNKEKCWGKANNSEPIRGAVAIFETTAGIQAVVFSGECQMANDYPSLIAAASVRTTCVVGIPGLRHCTPAGRLPVFDEQVFIPGARPEFPNAIYVVRGVAEGSRVLREGMVITRLRVDKYQAVPKEMFGAFMYYNDHRISLIEEYLTGKYFNVDGYKLTQ